MKDIKHTETSFLHKWREVNRFIMHNALKVTGITWKNTWKGIKTIISIKNITTTITQSIEFNDRTIEDPTAMSNVFNNYFTSIAEKTKSNVKFLSKHYADYLSNTNTNTFFLTPTGKNTISFIISSLYSC